ncbi:hypothetical protein ACFL6U_05990 [Planctomycetota bacterium]
MEYLAQCTLASAAAVLSAIDSFPVIYAYVDPGTGSLIIQLLIGFLFGAAFAARMFWSRIKEWSKKVLSRKKNAQINKDC